MPTGTRRSTRRSASAQRELVNEQATKKRRRSSRRSNSAASAKRTRRSSRKSEAKEREDVDDTEELNEREDIDETEEITRNSGLASIEETPEVSDLQSEERGRDLIEGQNLNDDFEEVSHEQRGTDSGLRRRRVVEEEEENAMDNFHNGESTESNVSEGKIAKMWEKYKKFVPTILAVIAFILIYSFWGGIFRQQSLNTDGLSREEFEKLKDSMEVSFNKQISELGEFYKEKVDSLGGNIEELTKKLKESFENGLSKEEKGKLLKAAIEKAKEQVSKYTKEQLSKHTTLKKKIETEVDKIINKKIREISENLKKFQDKLQGSEKMYEKLRSDQKLQEKSTKDNAIKLANEIKEDMKQFEAQMDSQIKKVKIDAMKPVSDKEMKEIIVKHAVLNIEALIQEKLEKYSADRTGMVDYALYSGGSRIKDSSPTYTAGAGKDVNIFKKLMSWSKGRTPQPPATILKPGNLPGQCWPMAGSAGYVTIKLSKTIVPQKLTLEHAPETILLRTDTAPKLFEVYGIDSKAELVKLSDKLEFKHTASGIETYDLKSDTSFKTIMVKFLENYGGKYTCIYRVRVHGNPETL